MNPNYKTCQNCGWTGPDVRTKMVYIGGAGHTNVDQCFDLEACAYRRDELDKLQEEERSHGNVYATL